MVERKNRLTGQNLGPASGGAEFLADADDALLKAIGSAASGVNSLPDPYGTLMDAAPGNKWDPSLGVAQRLGDLKPVRSGLDALQKLPGQLGRGGNAALDDAQKLLLGGLDAAGGALETADAAVINALQAGARGAQQGYGTARGEVADFLGGVVGTPQRNLAGIRNFLSGAGGSDAPYQHSALSSDLVPGTNDYFQALMKKKDQTPAEREAIAEYLLQGGILRDNDIMVPPEIMSSAYSPYGSGETDNSTLEALRNAITAKEEGNLIPGEGPQASGPGPASTAVTETDPNRDRPLDNRDAVYQKMYQEQQAALINQLFPTFEGGNAMGLAEQQAATNRGYARDRYGDMKTYLGAERERAGGQFDSDEEAIIGQLLQQDQERRDAEGWYEAKRTAEFGETERKLDARTSAASTRLNNLGIDPTKYTEMVGTEMGALLGAQMQSGSDLAHRMSMLGAERARLGMGRAKSGFAKERRQFDADASDMLFQGSQRLSYELQDINNALMNRRISGAEAKDAAAAAANAAQMQAQRAMHFGTSQLAMDPVAAAMTSSIPGSMNKMIDAAPTGRAITITEGMLPPEWDALIGQEISIDDWAEISKTLEVQSRTLNN